MSKPVKLFAISTCGWCKRAKRLFEENAIAAEITEVDLLEGETKEKVRAEVSKFNPRLSYPTIVIGEEVVVGFDEDRIRELLGL